jgi:hypothetical protein
VCQPKIRISKAPCIGNVTIENPTRFFIKCWTEYQPILILKEPGSSFEGEINTRKGEHC